jgi:hypothetical protein
MKISEALIKKKRSMYDINTKKRNFSPVKKTAFIFSFIQLFFGFSFAQVHQVHKGQIDSAKVPVLDFHYQSEHKLDKSTEPDRWETGQKGLQVAFGSTDALYFRTEVPDVEKQPKSWSETGWRGERLNAQVLVWSSDTLEQVRFQLNDLVNENGNRISKSNISTDMVGYVISNYPYGARDVVCGTSPYKDGYLMPDRFEKFERFELPGKTIRPVWLGLNVPAGTRPGVYKGQIDVLSSKEKKTLHVTIRVQDQVLPKPAEWKHQLDLWQNPWVVSEYYNVEPWSDEHKALLKKHLKPYADAGGKYITTYAVNSPWADNSYRLEGGMIEWVKKTDGKWKFDYKIFDEYVELAHGVGINGAITIYTPIPWGNRFRYIDEKTGNYVHAVWTPTSEEFKQVWNVFLDDLQAHLVKKGWFEKTYLGINENPLDQTLAAIKVIKDHSSKWRITYAGNWHQELDNVLDDYSFLFGMESNMEQVKARTERGFNTTYYVCCNPPFPNNFVFSPPIEGRWISWYTSAFGYNGFLRWAYDAWPGDPNRDARHGSWAAGDCYLIYPGGNSGIRFEKLREGIVDFEKIRILKELVAKSDNKKDQRLLKEFEEHLKTIALNKDFNEVHLKEAVDNGRKMIAELSARLKP